MDNEKRVIVAFALSFVMLLIWRILFVTSPPPPKSSGASKKTSHQATAQKNSPASSAKSQAPAVPAPPQIPVAEGKQTQEIVVESNLYRITFSTRGGVIKSWILRKFKNASGKPLDVVNPDACKQLGYPMSIKTSEDSLNHTVNHALYIAQPAGTTLLKAPATLEFTYSDGHVQVQKKFVFGSGYQVKTTVSVAQDQHYVPAHVAWIGGFGDHSIPLSTEISQTKFVYESGGKLETEDQHKVKQQMQQSGPLEFAGVEDRYFAGIFFPESHNQSFRAGQTSWTPESWKGKEPPQAAYTEFGSSVAQPVSFKLFVAPKALNVLESTHPSLEGLVDFGWFGVIAKPLFLGLRYIYDNWVHNYGWAIVILTLIINMALFPLKLKSIRSAQEMQRIAPLVKGIQDRYKQYKFNDPRKARMNQEIMKLYQEHNVSMFGGCLPMIPQIPILYAFYESLEAPFAFRHAPWILWIKDLSMPDPSHILGLPIPILPVIMMVSMFVMTKMTPMMTADPNQKRMMMVMPLIFGLMFFRLASGLVLYFLAANVVGIIQQLIINHYFTPKPKPPSQEKMVEANA